MNPGEFKTLGKRAYKDSTIRSIASNVIKRAKRAEMSSLGIGVLNGMMAVQKHRARVQQGGADIGFTLTQVAEAVKRGWEDIEKANIMEITTELLRPEFSQLQNLVSVILYSGIWVLPVHVDMSTLKYDTETEKLFFDGDEDATNTIVESPLRELIPCAMPKILAKLRSSSSCNYVVTNMTRDGTCWKSSTDSAIKRFLKKYGDGIDPTDVSRTSMSLAFWKHVSESGQGDELVKKYAFPTEDSP